MTNTMTARDEELIARHLLAMPERLGMALKEKRWADVAAVVAFARRDVPPALAVTDLALYRELRDQITRFYLRGGGALSLEKLRCLASSGVAIMVQGRMAPCNQERRKTAQSGA